MADLTELDDFGTPWGVERCIFLDFETTGLNPGYRPVSISWVEVSPDFEVIERVDQRINPEIPIEPGATRIHGISDAHVQGEPTIDEFIYEVLCNPFEEQGLAVIGHNVWFDLEIFTDFYQPVTAACTMNVARCLLPKLDNHRLETVAKSFHLETQGAHNSAVDVFLSYQIACELYGIDDEAPTDFARWIGGDAKEVPGELSPLLQLVFRSISWPADLPMPFGKHKGVPICELPSDYVQWLRENLDRKQNYPLFKHLDEM